MLAVADQALATASSAFIWVGVLLVLALAAEWVGRQTPLPRITALLLAGIVVGPAGMDLLPAQQEDWETIATVISLAMVGFLLGGEFERENIRRHGRNAGIIAAVAAAITAVAASLGLLAVGAPVAVALALGGIAAASGPAVTLVVIQEEGAKGPFPRTLLGMVAFSDALAIMLFSVMVAAGSLVDGGSAAGGVLVDALRDIGGGILLGAVVGAPAAVLSTRIRRGDATLVEGLAVVLLLAGLAVRLEVSFLLAAVVAGAVVANVPGESRPLRAIEHVEWPFLAVFFVLGGAALELSEVVGHVGLIAAYVVARTVGKVVGGIVGGRFAGVSSHTRRWMGAGLLPQAGVGLGLALLARDRLPELADTLVPVLVVSTVVFELIGPVATRAALRRVNGGGSADHAGRSSDHADRS